MSVQDSEKLLRPGPKFDTLYQTRPLQTTLFDKDFPLPFSRSDYVNIFDALQIKLP